MKKVINILIALVLSVTALSSCDESMNFPESEVTETGQVSMTELLIDISNSETVINRSSSIDLSDYIIEIYYSSTGELAESWYYKDMPEIITLAVGDYRIDVKSHELESAAWDTPYIYGSTEFSVVKDNIASIGTVNCTLQNVKVTIQFEDELKELMGSDVVVKVVVGNKGSLDFAADETRAGYFEFVPESTTLVATFSGTVDGSTENGYQIYMDVAAGQHRIITYSLKDASSDIPDEYGVIVPSVSVDANIDTQDLTIDVPVYEENIEPDPKPDSGDTDTEEPDDTTPDTEVDGAPVITSNSIVLGATAENVVSSGMTADVDIVAENGIAGLTVVIVSEQLSPSVLSTVGLSDYLDLVNPGDLKEAIQSLELPVEEEVVGETEMNIDISEFMPMLMIYKGTHQFVLTVTDSEGLEVVETLTFVVK
ncbi:MAG: DUF4493 domain-containing protein [Bacteroidales bacterium]